MSSYFVAQIQIQDKEEYKKYLEGFDEIFEKYKGEVLAVDDNPILLEGKWSYSRFVIINFPNEYELRSWYESPEYKKLAQHRFKASKGDVVIVKGYD